MIRYELPKRWIRYDASAVMAALVEEMCIRDRYRLGHREVLSFFWFGQRGHGVGGARRAKCHALRQLPFYQHGKEHDRRLTRGKN